MNLQSVVDDVKGRFEGLTSQGQKAAKVSLDTLKQANEVVVDSVQSLVKGNADAAKDLFSSAKSGFDKARADGVKAVVSAPTSYLPPRDKFVGVLKDSRSIVIKTSDDLVKLVKEGYSSINGDIDDVAKEVKASARKTASKARSTASKTAKKASKTVKSATK